MLSNNLWRPLGEERQIVNKFVTLECEVWFVVADLFGDVCDGIIGGNV